MATFLTFCTLTKVLAFFLSLLVHIHCLHAPTIDGGELEKELSRVSKRLPSAASSNHRHRHHKTAKSRGSKHNGHRRQEKQKFSRAEKELTSGGVIHLEDKYFHSFHDKHREEKTKELQISLDKEKGLHNNELNLKETSSYSSTPPHDRERTASPYKTLPHDRERTASPYKTSPHDRERTVSPYKTSPHEKENARSPHKPTPPQGKEKATLSHKTTLPHDKERAISPYKTTRPHDKETGRSPYKTSTPLKKYRTKSTHEKEEPTPPYKTTPLHQKEKTFPKQDVISEKPVTPTIKETREEQSWETESLSYTDQDGDLHDLEGFFDDNVTSTSTPDDSSWSLNETYQPIVPDCRECQKRKEMRETIRESRKRALQQQILFALRMEKPPNATGRRYPKAPGFMHLIRNNENLMMADAPSGGHHNRNSHGLDDKRGFHEEIEPEEELVRTKLIYIRAQAVSEDVTQNITDGVYFTLPEQLRTSRIKKAHLWVYINRPSSPIARSYVELSIMQIAPETRGSERIVQKPIKTKKLYTDKIHKPWRQIDFKRVLEFWSKRPEFNFGVQIRAMDDNNNNLVVLPPDEEYAPLVMVSLEKDKAHSRHRRSQSLVCTESSHESRCCRYPLEIGFVELGWDWIIAPLYVRADYCSGECHMTMLDATPNSWITQQMEGGGGSCCVPTRMQPLSLLYFDENHNILYQILQNVKVSKCGCA